MGQVASEPCTRQRGASDKAYPCSVQTDEPSTPSKHPSQNHEISKTKHITEDTSTTTGPNNQNPDDSEDVAGSGTEHCASNRLDYVRR